MPEFVRLRGVRLSNVDSFQFKDFNGPTRWDHCIAVAALAVRCAEKRRISERELIHLSLAALFHDVATPPFAHTMEHVLEGFDHEVESQRILKAVPAGDANPDFPVFASQLPQFRKICDSVSRQLGVSIDPDEVGRLVVGDGDLGFLLNGSLDLDNADNVTRASLHLGIEVDRQVPLNIADWLATQDGVPLNLSEVREEAVIKWLRYRKELYGAFFNSSDEELGRQAFLQHLGRRALLMGIPRIQLVWNTDEGFLTLLEAIDGGTSDNNGELSAKELVQRYRLFEPTIQIANTPIEDDESLRIINSPVAMNWIERELSGHAFEPFVLVNVRRYLNGGSQGNLFPPAPGSLTVFKLGQTTKTNQLPGWLRQDAPLSLNSQSLRRFLSEALRKKISIWVREKPWLRLTSKRKEDVRKNLDAVGDWSFRLSRNETLHSYPSTFVHAIPACLINTLGLRGELVVDTFGGTGQTAVEAIKAGGRAVTADVNSVAVLVAQSKLTYLSAKQRSVIKSITVDEIAATTPGKAPQFDLIEKWHHPKTLAELCRLRSFIQNQHDARVAQFLKATFSAILTLTTARKGKQHGFFADNTPLSKGEAAPPYENALVVFMAKLAKNLEVVQRLYSSIERTGRNPEEELKRAKALRVDVTKASPKDYGVEEGTVAGVITSPPYLCMSDYSLGQRLSYYWLFPDQMLNEHSSEIGARRKRFQPQSVLRSYLSDFERFAELAIRLLRPGGFLATVLGAPVAESFTDANILAKIDDVLKQQGFSMLWSKWRPIHWHRNHGYARLKEERIAVYAIGK
ncbi:MAG: HD domain-containing protein [Verrucomicrobia bacterium]|nr:HD domain-containing protein [Verrucomicrobiota bacterium]